MGLRPYARRLRKKRCPFWRIVVVWSISPESMRDWCYKAKFDAYDDPAYRSMRSIPIPYGTMMPLLSEMIGEREDAGSDAKRLPDGTLSVYAIRPKKKGKAKFIRLPPAVEEWRRRVEEQGERSRMKLPERIKMYAAAWFLEIFCFIRVHGVEGLERWLIARISPRRRIARFALRRRAHRLYRASRRRKSKKDGALFRRRQSVAKPLRLRPGQAEMK